MSDQMFKKAVTLTDVHFGRSQNSPVANQDNIDFIDWFIDEARAWGAETCIMLGDWHDSRHNLHVQTMHYSLQGMQKLNDAFEKVIWIPGNHDLLYRNKRDVSSVAFAKYLPNIHLINNPTTIGGVTILPWLVNEEPKKIKSIKSRYIFGHLELPGFMMNAKVPMPHHGESIQAEDFTSPEYVFSGHFHFRQAKGRVVYTGNTFPFNFADAWDEDRGMMFLEWGKEPFFKAWPDQPLFRTINLSQLVQQPEKYLKSKLTARVVTDLDMSYEESQALKESFVAQYGLRKFEYASPPRENVEQDFTGEISFQSVNQIVVEGLMSVDSTGISREVLVELFRGLPDL